MRALSSGIQGELERPSLKYVPLTVQGGGEVHSTVPTSFDLNIVMAPIFVKTNGQFIDLRVLIPNSANAHR